MRSEHDLWGYVCRLHSPSFEEQLYRDPPSLSRDKAIVRSAVAEGKPYRVKIAAGTLAPPPSKNP